MIDLIAHRGWAARYPENTLLAFCAAVEAGARYVELDVHLSSDRVPVVFHDETLERTTGTSGAISDLPLSKLRTLDAGHAARFGNRFAGTRISTLAETVTALDRWPASTIFVEIKRASIERFGLDDTVDRVIDALGAALRRCVIISFDRPAIEAARRCGVSPPSIGWVLDRYDQPTQLAAAALEPDFIFCDVQKLPPGERPLWAGPWRWAIYEVTDPAVARALAKRGASLIETMAIGEMLRELGAAALPRDG